MRIRPLLASRAAVAAAALLSASFPAPSAPPAATLLDAFSPQTMRLDLLHTGGMGTEIVAVDRIVSDGPWAGSLATADDGLGLGHYRFEVLEPATGRLLYARGYSSIYAEWETTPEAKAAHRTFRESLRFPWPLKPVQVVLKKRDRRNLFREVFSTLVDPASPDVNPAPPPKLGTVWTVFENGPATEKVDLLVLGEGYAEKDLPKFRSDVKRMVDTLFRYEPFKSRKADFNVRALDLSSGRRGRTPPAVEALPPHTPSGPVQHLRLRALRPDLRRPRPARRGLPGAVRRPRDPRQRRPVRRRRHLQPPGDRLGRHGLRRVRLRPRVRPPLRRPRGRVLHLRRCLRDRRGRPPRALGEERHRPEGPREPEVEGARREGDSAADPLVEGGLREDLPRVPGAPQGAPRRRRAPAAIDDLFREQKKVEAAFFAKEKFGRARSAPSRGRPTRRRGSTAPRPTASCSPAPKEASAPSAARPSRRSSTATGSSGV